MKIAITGGRDHIVTPSEQERFWSLFTTHNGTELHHGAARGVDSTIAEFVKSQHPDIAVIAHPADWNQHGKIAGFVRNFKMLSCVDILIAFPGGRGTNNCVQRARHMSVPVFHITRGEK